jgi:hypothetical protein
LTDLKDFKNCISKKILHEIQKAPLVLSMADLT